MAVGPAPGAPSDIVAAPPATAKAADGDVVHAPPISALPRPAATVRPKASAAYVVVLVPLVMFTCLVTLVVAPWLSVTVSVTGYLPRRGVGVCRGSTPEPVLLSPKIQA